MRRQRQLHENAIGMPMLLGGDSSHEFDEPGRLDIGRHPHHLRIDAHRVAAAALLFTYDALAAMSPTSTTTSRGRRLNISVKVRTSSASPASIRAASARPSRIAAVIGSLP